MDVLYWKPVPAKGSKGEKFLAEEYAGRQQGASNGEIDPGQDEHSQSNAWASSRTPNFCWPKDMKAHVAYGNALMGGPAYNWCFDEALDLYHKATYRGGMDRD